MASIGVAQVLLAPAKGMRSLKIGSTVHIKQVWGD
jgi:hypothetical protein